MIVTFKEMQDYLSLILNFQATQTTENFSREQLKLLLNLAQDDEYNLATQQGIAKHFRVYQDFTWYQDEVFQDAPQWCLKGYVIDFRDITDSPDTQIGTPTPIVFETWKQLRWGAQGPANDRTIRVRYFLTPLELVNDMDQVYWVPVTHRQLIVWAAACMLRMIAYKEVPQAWLSKRDELRWSFHKYVSRGLPTMDPPSVLPIYDGLYCFADNGYDVVPTV